MPALRKLTLVAALGIIVALAAFWILTLPAVVSGRGAAALQPNLANGKTMFDIGGCASCHAVPNKDPDKVDRTRLGGGLALKSPFGTFYAPEHFARSEGRHRELERSEFRHRAVEGHLGARHQPLSGLSLYVVSAHAARRCARPVRLSENPAGGPGPGRAVTIWRFLSTIGDCSAAGNCCSCTAGRSCPIRRNRRNGTGAPIWSTARAIAPNAIRRAMCLAASSKASALPAARRWTAMAGCRTSRRPDLRQGDNVWSEKDIASFLGDGMSRSGDFAGGGMAEVIRNTSLLSADDRAAIAAYIVSLPPVQGPPPPPKKN